MKIPWQAALGMVFCSGALFLALTFTGLRRKIIEAIPAEIKIAISCGIGCSSLHRFEKRRDHRIGPGSLCQGRDIV